LLFTVLLVPLADDVDAGVTGGRALDEFEPVAAGFEKKPRREVCFPPWDDWVDLGGMAG
jgi:hypothetical protein